MRGDQLNLCLEFITLKEHHDCKFDLTLWICPALSLSSAEALPQTRRKAREKEKVQPLQRSRGSWHVQQQQRLQLEKQNFYSDAQGRFYHRARRSSRAGSFSGLRQVFYSTGTIRYRRLIDQFSCFILKVRKFRSLLGQSVLS